MSKKSRFRETVKKQHAKCPQTLLKFEGQPLYHIFWSLGSQLSYKKSLLGISNISKLFPNPLTADGKYFLLDRDNVTQRIQMEFSQKQKPWSQFFSSFFKSSLNLQYFKKKITLIPDVFPKLWTPKNMVRSMRKKSCFRESVKKQHAKCPQTLFKFEGHPV